MNKVNLKYGLIALAGLGISANVSAADLTCSDVTFTPEAYAAYEFVDKACLEMVDRNGGTYAKMTAKIVAQTSSGTHIRFRHADGELGPSHKSQYVKKLRDDDEWQGSKDQRSRSSSGHQHLCRAQVLGGTCC